MNKKSKIKTLNHVFNLIKSENYKSLHEFVLKIWMHAEYKNSDHKSFCYSCRGIGVININTIGGYTLCSCKTPDIYGCKNIFIKDMKIDLHVLSIYEIKAYDCGFDIQTGNDPTDTDYFAIDDIDLIPTISKNIKSNDIKNNLENLCLAFKLLNLKTYCDFATLDREIREEFTINNYINKINYIIQPTTMYREVDEIKRYNSYLILEQ